MGLALHFHDQRTRLGGKRFIQLDDGIAMDIGLGILVEAGLDRVGAAQDQGCLLYTSDAADD